MYEFKPLSSNRTFIYHFLKRALRYHCPITANLRIDVTDTLKRIEECRSNGRKISFIAYTTLASAKTVEAHPNLNRRLYHGLFRKVLASFNHITVALVVGREDPTGENILLPLMIRDVHKCTLEEIHEHIKSTKTKELDTLDEYSKLQKLRKLPKFLIHFALFLSRLSPKYSGEQFATYALSSVTTENSVTLGGHTAASRTTFFPGNIRDEVLAINGKPEVRRVLFIGLSADHFVVDGMEVQQAITTFQNLMENPNTLIPE